MNSRARRVQLVLDDASYLALTSQAAADGTSMSQVAREAVAEYVAGRQRRAPRDEDPIERMIGAISTDMGDAASRVDEIVYGSRRAAGRRRSVRR